MPEIKLKNSITYDDITYDSLDMRSPKVRDHIWLEHQEAAMLKDKKKLGDVEKDALLFARLADVPNEVISQLEMSDLKKCQAVYLQSVVGLEASQEKSETS